MSEYLLRDIFDSSNDVIVRDHIHNCVADVPQVYAHNEQVSHVRQGEWIDCLNVYPSYCVKYSRFMSLDYSLINKSGLSHNKPKALLSYKGSRRIRLAIDWLLHITHKKRLFIDHLKKYVSFKINFITLTLPCSQIRAVIFCDGRSKSYSNYSRFFPAYNLGLCRFDFYYDDIFIKKYLLNHFLTQIRRKYKVQSYVWKAETQDNGNIHFHITTGNYIDYLELRNLWNNILAKTDMIERYQLKWQGLTFRQYADKVRLKQPSSESDLRRAYDYGVSTNWSNPNTTDIHSVWKVNDVAAYLSKYFVKHESDRRKIDGCKWRLSELLSSFKKYCGRISDELWAELGYLSNHYPNRVIIKDYATIFNFKIKDISNILQNSLIVEKFTRYRESVFKRISLAV